MGVYSVPTEESVGGESPKKRARTDSPSEHGNLLHLACFLVRNED